MEPLEIGRIGAAALASAWRRDVWKSVAPDVAGAPAKGKAGTADALYPPLEGEGRERERVV
jgi:hypothetical protein